MEALGTLAGGVAHDLNNILTGIVSYPDLLMGEFPEGSRMWRSLEKIKNSGLRASAIVQDLLTLARRAVPSMKVLDLHAVVTDFFNSPEFHQLSLIHPMIEISWDPQAKHPIILGSRIHITKAIMNLVINGMEAIEGSGAVTVSTSNTEKDHPDGNTDGKLSRYVVLAVQDNGIGMNEQDSERIFEPFYTKKAMGRSGSGLGMTVVYGAMQDHNGDIDIQSVEGEGSRIALYFPLTDLPLENDALPSSADHLGKGESVLVVDDIQEQRDVATAILKQLNYNPMAVSSGKEAIVFLRKYPADIILLDMIMEGGMDGLDTFIEIKRINPEQKVILVSGYSESSRVKEAIKMGARGYIQKPYLINRLGAAIQEQLTLPMS